MNKKFKISPKMTVGEVLKRYPKTLFVFLNYGFHCLNCYFSQSESLEEAAKLHQVDLKKLLKTLNKAVTKFYFL